MQSTVRRNVFIEIAQLTIKKNATFVVAEGSDLIETVEG